MQEPPAKIKQFIRRRGGAGAGGTDGRPLRKRQWLPRAMPLRSLFLSLPASLPPLGMPGEVMLPWATATKLKIVRCPRVRRHSGESISL